MKNDGGEDVKVVNEPPNSSEMIYKILNMIKAQIGVIVGVLSILLICLVMYIFSASWQAMSFKGWLSIFITVRNSNQIMKIFHSPFHSNNKRYSPWQ